MKHLTGTMVIAGAFLFLQGHLGYASKSTTAQVREEEVSTRLAHARELLGKGYNSSVVKTSERIPALKHFVAISVEQSLRGRWKKFAKPVANAIMQESFRYGFDPIFLMAVIQNESSFQPGIVGTSGEVGLMQITPITAEWIADKYGLAYKGRHYLFDPVNNIRIGAAYLSFLREKFDFNSRLYLSAYNMGISNVNRALDHDILPQEYASRVLKRYVNFYREIKEHLQPVVAKKVQLAQS